MEPTVITEGKHRGEYIVSEANGSQSRETVTFAQGAAVVTACTVMGILAATGKYVPLVPGANDGSQNAAGISYGNVDVTLSDRQAVITARNSEVNASDLVWGTATPAQIATGQLQLAALGIISRIAI